MINVEQAQSIIKAKSLIVSVERIEIEKSLGRICKESIFADRDFPPFNRVTMDGLAVCFNEKSNAWPIENIQFAGQAQLILQNPKAGIEAMTGAMLPLGTDTIIRYEDIDIQQVNGQKIAKLKSPFPIINQGQNIHRQGSDRQKGELLIPENTIFSPAEIAVAASVGASQILVATQPKVAIISTGDELIDVSENPLPYQIRKSNGLMLSTALQSFGITAQLFHLQDDIMLLTESIGKILAQYDVLILSGGVSAGKADFIPQVLESLGVVKYFHQVAQRPGKPFWFGTSVDDKMVFALPGNPVSTFVCFLKYVCPILSPAARFQPPKAALATSITFKPNLTYFVPVRVECDQTGRNIAYPLAGNGSGDFTNLLEANAFLELPKEESFFESGQVFDVLWFR